MPKKPTTKRTRKACTPSADAAKKATRVKAAKVPAADRVVSTGDNDAKRASFLHHRSSYVAIQAKIAAVKKLEDGVIAALKADGHSKKEMQIADILAGGHKKELKVVEDVGMKIRIASYMGHSLGNQLDLFAQPDRTPSVDIAADLGKQDCMEHKAASPPYTPETEQYRRYMEAYHKEQERQLKAGIKPLAGDGKLDDKTDEDDDGNPLVEADKPDPARPFSDFN